MKYKIKHNTTYVYKEPVPVCQNSAHLTPRDHPYQRCVYHRLVIKPLPTSSDKRLDFFGNPLSYFEISESHSKLSVTAVSKIEVRPRELPNPALSPPWETVVGALQTALDPQSLNALQLAFSSPLARRSPKFAEYARTSFSPAAPVVAAVLDLTRRINAEFTYDPASTTINTPLDEVFAKRRGVCQDLAHLQVACLRSLGLPARYVSGYLRTIAPPGKTRLVGADASHAWLAAYCGDQLGWIDVDPTNNLTISTDHITVAWGRDYGDVCPINGMYVGGGLHEMTVAVEVVPINVDSAS